MLISIGVVILILIISLALLRGVIKLIFSCGAILILLALLCAACFIL